MIFVFCYKNNENLEIELLYELIDVCRDPRNAKLAKGDSDNADNKHQSTFKIRWRRLIPVTDRAYCRPQSETSYHNPGSLSTRPRGRFSPASRRRCNEPAGEHPTTDGSAPGQDEFAENRQ